MIFSWLVSAKNTNGTILATDIVSVRIGYALLVCLKNLFLVFRTTLPIRDNMRIFRLRLRNLGLRTMHNQCSDDSSDNNSENGCEYVFYFHILLHSKENLEFRPAKFDHFLPDLCIANAWK